MKLCKVKSFISKIVPAILIACIVGELYLFLPFNNPAGDFAEPMPAAEQPYRLNDAGVITPERITIKGIQYNTDRIYLNFAYRELTSADIEPLKYMTGLENLNLSVNSISDLSPLRELVNLTRLDIQGNPFNDISALSGLEKLTHLNIWGFHCELRKYFEVTDLSPLRGLYSLEDLSMAHHNFADLTPLGNLINLRILSIPDNNITDISPLRGLINLTYLRLEDNNISDIDIGLLLSMPKLADLWLYGNPISEERIIELQNALPHINVHW
jgi:internalin A